MRKITPKKQISTSELNNQISEERKFKYKPPTKSLIIIKIFILLSIVVILSLIFKKNKGILHPQNVFETTGEFAIAISAIFLLLLLFYLSMSIIFNILSRYYFTLYRKEAFLPLFLITHSFFIEMLVGFLGIITILKLGPFVEDTEAVVLELNDVKSKDNFTIIIGVYSILTACWCFFFLICYLVTCKFTCSFLSFKIYYEHFRDKILKNEEKCNFLKILEFKAPKNCSLENPKAIFDFYAQNKNSVTKADFIAKKWTEDEVIGFFDTWELQIEYPISQEEFLDSIYDVYNQKLNLKKSLVSKDSGLMRLKIVIYVIFLPFLLLGIGGVIGRAEDFKGIMAATAGILLPLNFVFGSILAELFKSTILLFFIRPFDIGDIIQYQDEIYEVYEIGLLYTTFLKDSRKTNFPNKKICDDVVVNLNKSKYQTELFIFRIKKDDYFLIRKKMFKSLRNYIKKHPKYFKTEAVDLEFKCKDEGYFEVALGVKLSSQVNYPLAYNVGKIKIIKFMGKNYPSMLIKENKRLVS